MKADLVGKILYWAAYAAAIVGIMAASIPLWRWFINAMVVCK